MSSSDMRPSDMQLKLEKKTVHKTAQRSRTQLWIYDGLNKKIGNPEVITVFKSSSHLDLMQWSNISKEVESQMKLKLHYEKQHWNKIGKFFSKHYLNKSQTEYNLLHLFLLKPTKSLIVFILILLIVQQLYIYTVYIIIC